MKLIVTIPAYNEQRSIAQVIKSIPRHIAGISKIEILVWDDGSTDNTAQQAKKAGATYVFSNKKNLGLAQTFQRAVRKAIERGADIVVNTDADNQYLQSEIPHLIQPILDGVADVVNGDRQVETLKHMPRSKKYGNLIGSWFLRMLTKLHIRDASSGFRAYTAQAITTLHIFSTHTYTHESLIQLALSELTIVEVPVTFLKRQKNIGQSRLISNVPIHIIKSLITILRSILMYRPLHFFISVGLAELLISGILGARYMYFVLTDQGGGHIQSLILASMLFNLALITMLIGIMADLITLNRKLTEHIRDRL